MDLGLERTMDVGFGALTGRPFALTGARVPAASALRWSRWTWRGIAYQCLFFCLPPSTSLFW